jgi:hypothetical protein
VEAALEQLLVESDDGPRCPMSASWLPTAPLVKILKVSKALILMQGGPRGEATLVELDRFKKQGMALHHWAPNPITSENSNP